MFGVSNTSTSPKCFAILPFASLFVSKQQPENWKGDCIILRVYLQGTLRVDVRSPVWVDGVCDLQPRSNLKKHVNTLKKTENVNLTLQQFYYLGLSPWL